MNKSKKYKAESLTTIARISGLTGMTDSRIRQIVTEGGLTSIYPDYTRENKGQMFIVCDKKLEYFLIKSSTHAGRKLGLKDYDPFTEAKKLFQFV